MFPCLPVCFYIKPVSFSRLCHAYSSPVSHIFLHLLAIIFSSNEHKSPNTSLWSFLEPPVTISFLSCNIFFSTLITLYQVLTHLNQQKNLFLYTVTFIFFTSMWEDKKILDRNVANVAVICSFMTRA